MSDITKINELAEIIRYNTSCKIYLYTRYTVKLAYSSFMKSNSSTVSQWSIGQDTHIIREW